MKKWILFVLVLICMLSLVACDNKSGKDFDETKTFSFQAKVLEVHDSYLLVEPLANSNESKSAGRIQVSLKDKKASWSIPVVDDLVEIVYDGNIMETYPAQLGKVYRIEVVKTTSTSE